MQTVGSSMRQNVARALGIIALVLSGIVYLAGLIYAGVRSYSLFAATISADMLALALLGIVALELSALALPLALHYWTAPGIQRIVATLFYLADMALIIANAILDAAHHSGTVLPEFLTAYGTYAVPALPVFCMAMWAIVWAVDPASREADMQAAVKAATQEALFSQMIRAAEAVDITAQVEAAAGEAARALVAETLGRAPKGAPSQPRPEAAQEARPDELLPRPMPEAAPAPEAQPALPAPQPEQQAEPKPIPELAEPVRQRRNGHSKAADGPKA